MLTNIETCKHTLVYHWQRLPDGTTRETMKCLTCGAYIVDTKQLELHRFLAGFTSKRQQRRKVLRNVLIKR